MITLKQLLINFSSTSGSLNFGTIIIDYFLVAPKFCMNNFSKLVPVCCKVFLWCGHRDFKPALVNSVYVQFCYTYVSRFCMHNRTIRQTVPHIDNSVNKNNLWKRNHLVFWVFSKFVTRVYEDAEKWSNYQTVQYMYFIQSKNGVGNAKNI